MKDDYIRKEEAIDAATQDSTENRTHSFRAGQARSASRIKALEPADVVPVVHGKWIPHREKSREYIGTVLVHVMYDYWLCDTCGYRVENGQPTYNFCPNCGAKMVEYNG